MKKRLMGIIELLMKTPPAAWAAAGGREEGLPPTEAALLTAGAVRRHAVLDRTNERQPNSFRWRASQPSDSEHDSCPRRHVILGGLQPCQPHPPRDAGGNARFAVTREPHTAVPLPSH